MLTISWFFIWAFIYRNNCCAYMHFRQYPMKNEPKVLGFGIPETMDAFGHSNNRSLHRHYHDQAQQNRVLIDF